MNAKICCNFFAPIFQPACLVSAIVLSLVLPATAQVHAEAPAQIQVRELLAANNPESVSTALALAEKQLQLAPESALAHYLLARACGAKAALSGTLRSVPLWRRHGQHLREAARLQPTDGEVVLALIGFLSRAPMLVGGDLEDARKWQATLSKADPASGLVATGYLHYAEGKLDAAVEANFAALRAHPSHPEALTALVQVLAAHNRIHDAALWIKAAVAAAPRDQKARWAVIRYAAATGDAVAPAQEYLDSFDQQAKTLVMSWEIAWLRGQILLRANRLPEAVKELVRAQSLNPSAKQVALTLKEALAEGKSR
jgi:tetratricopeptide (TPR) repeat protein